MKFDCIRCSASVEIKIPRGVAFAMGPVRCAPCLAAEREQAERAISKIDAYMYERAEIAISDWRIKGEEINLEILRDLIVEAMRDVLEYDENDRAYDHAGEDA